MKRVFAHIGFSFAITLFVLNLLNIKATFVIMAITGVAFAVSFIVRKTRKSIAVPLCMFSAFLATVLFSATFYINVLPQLNLDNKNANAEFYIISQKEERSDKYYYTAKTISIDDENAPQSIKLNIKSDIRLDVDYYQVLNGNFDFYSISDSAFNSYGNYGNGVYLSANLNSCSKTDKSIFSINKYILELRDCIKNMVMESIDEDCASVILALLIGDKSELGTELKNDFISCGVSHIMAVSGLHLVVFTSFLYFFLRKLFIPKIPCAVIMAISVLFYIALSGFSKSVIRAGIMMLILLLGKMFKEKSDAMNSLGFATFIICLNPYALTDSSALLTVCAVLGLISINPLFKKWIKPKTKAGKYIFDIVSASVSVFISTLPVVYFTFGYVSTLGIVLNIIMIPLLQITLISSLLMISLCFISPAFSLFSIVAKSGAFAMIYITKICSSFPFAVIGLNKVEYGIAIAGVMLLFGIGFIVNGRNFIKSCSIISAFMFAFIIVLFAVVNKNNVYVREINGYYSTAVIVYDNESAFIIGVDDYLQYNTARNIVKSYNLEISAVVDASGSDYSKMLADEFTVINYVTSIEDADEISNCYNIYTDDYFDVDFSNHFNVKYIKTGKQTSVEMMIYNSAFGYSENSEYVYSGSNVVILNDNSNNSDNSYDVVYTVTENGYSERRLNEWQK